MSGISWSFQLLRAGSFRLDGGSMFGVVPKAIWKTLVEQDTCQLRKEPLAASRPLG